ncbi:MAG TPA: diacylglycerol kinase family protein [Verrucomicrobiae bacterium]
MRNHLHVRICVIFNPTARGNKARHFRQHLGDVAGDCAFKATAAGGDARRLAAEAVAEGFDLIVATGGDGTVNEVLNGIGDVPDGFVRARLGVLPLGTVNVFARELKIPAKLKAAWEILRRGNEARIDLPQVEFLTNGKTERRYFAQLAGAGLDARAVELVSWKLKKKAGPLAYAVAGFQALMERQPKITVQADGKTLEGELVLIGNGRFYGGSIAIFPAADLHDGQLDVCVLPRANLPTFLRHAPSFLFRQKLPEKAVSRINASRFQLTSQVPVAFELDGEWVGHLPATFSLEREKLRVAVP